MDLFTIGVIILALSALATVIVFFAWFILLFANRKKSHTAGKVLLFFIALTTVTFAIDGWLVPSDTSLFIEILATLIILVAGGFATIPIIITMTIVKHIEEKRNPPEKTIKKEPRVMTIPDNPIFKTSGNASSPHPKQFEKKTDIILDAPSSIPNSFKSDVILDEPKSERPLEQASFAQPTPPSPPKPIVPPTHNTIYNTLRHRESMGAKFLFNVNPSPNSDFPAIDIMIIDPYGIFAIEAENRSGLLLGSVESMDWEFYADFKKTGAPAELIINPVLANNYNIDMLRSKIDMQNVPVYNLVIVPDDCELHGDISKNASVIKMSKLKDTIQTLCSIRSICMMSSDIKKTYQDMLSFSTPIN